MVEETPQTKTNLHPSVGVPIILAVVMYALDFFTKFDGLNIFRLTQGKSGLYLFSQGVLAIVAAFAFIYIILNRGKKSRQMIIIAIILGLEGTIILLFGGFNVGVLLHLILPWFIISAFKDASDTEERVAVTRIMMYFVDFIGFGIVNMSLNNPLLGNRLVFPIYVLYAIWKGYEHAEKGAGRTILTTIVVFIIILYAGALIDGVRIISEYQKFGPDKVRDLREFLADSAQNLRDMGTSIKTSWNETINSIFNPTSYLPGQQEQTEDPQGIFIEPLEPGHIFTEGMPVYAWALLEARTLDDPITALISCKTERETEFGEKEIKGITDPDQLLVIKGAERSISCQFPPLPEDNYEIIFNAQFNFSADAIRKIYLMDRDRLLEDLRLLRQKGLEPGRDTLLRELYDITDTDPELIYTSGPISIGMKTDNVPWDVGKASQSTLKPLFGVTITNYWPKGGRIKRINNLYFKVPDEMNLLTGLCDPNTPMKPTDEKAEPGYKVYKLDTEELITTQGEEILVDVDEFRTFNCRIEVDENSLDNVPVTTRFLKVHVDYDYVLEEGLDVDVEGLGLGQDAEGILNRNQFCCQYRYIDPVTKEDKISSYGWVDSLELCYTRDSFAYGIDVDRKYCEQFCCEVSYVGTDKEKNHYWVESAEECDEYDRTESYSQGDIIDKYKCEYP